MKLVSVSQNSAYIGAFHQVCDRIYQGDPVYIKPIQSDVEAIFDPNKNNSFKKGNALRFLLLGEDNRTPVGRIAAFYQDKAGKRRGDTREATAIVSDINDAMLEAGKARSDNAKWGDRLSWVCADGKKLPYPDKSFDVVTVSFGIRNFADRVAGLREFRRILKTGGRLAVLEFSHMTAPILQEAYDRYSFAVIPRLGELIASDRDSYQYLIESIRKFPDQQTFKSEIEGAGFRQVSVTNYSGGIAALHFGWAV